MPSTKLPPAGSPKSLNVSSVLLRVVLAVLVGGLAYFVANDRLGLPSQTANAAFAAVDITGKGKGLVALRDIKQGELLIRETPLFVVPQSTTESPTALIWRLLQGASPEGQFAFWDLSYVNLPQDVDPKTQRAHVALAVFNTNAVAAGENVAIFPGMARLNHGCSSAFNVVYTWRKNEEALYVHALKNISKGQELLTTYTDTKRTRSERRDFLSAQYGFKCTCAVCSLDDASSAASDKRLTKIADYYRHFGTWGNGAISGVEAVDTINKIWQLEDEEGYWSERGRLAADAAWIAAAHSDAPAVRMWAGLAIKWYTVELGADNELVADIRKSAENPEVHPAWRSREPLIVGAPVTWIG